MDEKRFISEVFEKMKSNPDLAGTFSEDGGRITWQLFEGYTVEIASEYIGVHSQRPKGGYRFRHHWHPDDEDLYADICALGTRGNVTIILRTFGDTTGVVYSGPRAGCPEKKNGLFRKYIYLYAE